MIGDVMSRQDIAAVYMVKLNSWRLRYSDASYELYKHRNLQPVATNEFETERKRLHNTVNSLALELVEHRKTCQHWGMEAEIEKAKSCLWKNRNRRKWKMCNHCGKSIRDFVPTPTEGEER